MINFDFTQITVAELDGALEAGRFSVQVREALAKVTGMKIGEVNQLNADEYRKLVSRFVKAAFSPVENDPS